MTGAIATAKTDIEATPDQVWAALTDPAQIKQYMFGSEVQTDWQVGSPIVWQGEYEGKRYEDKGEILEFEPGRRLSMTHFSAMSGAEDTPENYHTLTYELQDFVDRTHVTLSQDGNKSDEEVEHSTQNWETMLASLKKVVESGAKR